MKHFFLFLFLFIFSNAYSGEIFDKFNKKLALFNGIEASFLQEVHVKGMEDTQKFSGELFISKPDKVKVIYEEPIKQIVFIKKDKTIIYTPEEKQAVISKLSKDFIVVNIFKNLSSKSSLSDIFNVKEENEYKNGFFLVLEPVNNRSIKKIYLYLNKEMSINEIKIIDKDGNMAKILFKDFKYLKAPPEVELKLPEDVEIMRY